MMIELVRSTFREVFQLAVVAVVAVAGGGGRGDVCRI